VVERVIKFTAKLNLDALTGDTKVLERRQIALVLPWSPIHLPRGIANVSDGRRREYAGIEKAVAVSRPESKLWTGGQIDSLAVSAADKIGSLHGAETDVRRRAAREGDRRRDVPMRQQRFRNRIAHTPGARYFVERGDVGDEGAIEIR